jgi:hypothetical protein
MAAWHSNYIGLNTQYSRIFDKELESSMKNQNLRWDTRTFDEMREPSVRICPFSSPMRATKESNDFTSGEIIGRLLYMRAVRNNISPLRRLTPGNSDMVKLLRAKPWHGELSPSPRTRPVLTWYPASRVYRYPAFYGWYRSAEPKNRRRNSCIGTKRPH